MRIVARVPHSRAASATAWAWLPEVAASTPAARCSAVSDEIALYAPRNFERPGPLEALGLEVYLGADDRVERLRGDDGRAVRDALQPGRGAADVIERRGHRMQYRGPNLDRRGVFR